MYVYSWFIVLRESLLTVRLAVSEIKPVQSLTDRRTDGQTDRNVNYSNSRCACARGLIILMAQATSHAPAMHHAYTSNCTYAEGLHSVAEIFVHYYVPVNNVHVLMRDKKEGRSNKQTRQSNTAHPRQSLFPCMCIMYIVCT